MFEPHSRYAKLATRTFLTEDGRTISYVERGASSWSLEEIDTGDAKLSDEPLALAVDGLGVIHVIATTSSGEHLDWWSDHRTDWTLTAVSERVKLAHAGGPAAVTRSIDGEQLVVTSPPSGSQGGLQLASFGLPRSVGPVASDESVKPIAELVRRLTR